MILFATTGFAATELKLLPVNYFKPKLVDKLEYSKTYFGLVKSAKRSDLAFEFLGKVNKFYVDEGDYIKEGQALVTMDTKLLKTQEMELTASLKEVNANIRLAKARFQRFKQLVKDRFVSKQQFDEVLATKDALLAKQQSLLAKIDNIQLRMKKSVLKAPFKGQITKKLIEEGDVINAGETVLQIINDENYEVHVGIPSVFYQKVKKGENIKGTVNKLTITGKIRAIRYDLSDNTRTLNLIINIPAKNTIPVGSFASITIPITDKVKGSWVPINSLKQNFKGLWSLYVLHQNSDYYDVTREDISLIFSNNRCAFVNLQKNNMMIVANGVHKLVEGQRVKLAKQIKLGELKCDE